MSFSLRGQHLQHLRVELPAPQKPPNAQLLSPPAYSAGGGRVDAELLTLAAQERGLDRDALAAGVAVRHRTIRIHGTGQVQAWLSVSCERAEASRVEAPRVEVLEALHVHVPAAPPQAGGKDVAMAAASGVAAVRGAAEAEPAVPPVPAAAHSSRATLFIVIGGLGLPCVLLSALACSWESERRAARRGASRLSTVEEQQGEDAMREVEWDL